MSIDVADEDFEDVPAARVPRIDYAMTLEEIGAELGITRERVRQIEEKALRKVAMQWRIREDINRARLMLFMSGRKSKS